MSSTPTALTYRSLFAIGEFGVLFVNRCVVAISLSASGLALATITYQATRSAVLSGLSMFGGPLVSLVVSQLLLASSDRVRPRTALICQLAAALICDALQLVPGMAWQARFGLLAIPYASYAVFGGTRWVLLREIVPAGSYVLARSTMNVADGGMQVVGYGMGGLALLWLSPRGLFGFAAFADLLALASVRLGIRDRPARTARGTGNVVGRTAAVNLALLRSPLTRPLYIALWVPNGLIVGCESLFVPYGHAVPGYGAISGWLFATTAAGAMTGEVVVGRFVPPGWRDRIIGPLRLLLAVPYLFLFLAPPVAIVVPLGFAASAGYAASLPLQDRLIRHTDEAIGGQVLGLHTNGMLVGQAIGALAAGAVASRLPPAAAMGTLAAASTAVTLLLIPGLRRSAGTD